MTAAFQSWLLMLFFVCFVFLWDRVLLCSVGWPQTHGSPLASASKSWTSTVYAAVPDSLDWFKRNFVLMFLVSPKLWITIYKLDVKDIDTKTLAHGCTIVISRVGSQVSFLLFSSIFQVGCTPAPREALGMLWWAGSTLSIYKSSCSVWNLLWLMIKSESLNRSLFLTY